MIPHPIPNTGPNGGMLQVMMPAYDLNFYGPGLPGPYHGGTLNSAIHGWLPANASVQGYGHNGVTGTVGTANAPYSVSLTYPAGVVGLAYNANAVTGVAGLASINQPAPANISITGVSGSAVATVTSAGNSTMTGLRGSAKPSVAPTTTVAWGTGIGAEVSASGPLANAYGLRAAGSTSVTSVSNVYGVSGTANSGSNRYGVYGSAPVAVTYPAFQAGVYGNAPQNGTLSPLNNGTWTNNSSWAVYANGPQFSTTNALWGTSDARLKENIKPLQGSLAAILKLAPKTYSYLQGLHPSFNLPKGMQMGLIAQDVEKVLPALVMDTHAPDQFDTDGKLIDPGFDFKAMSYTGLIPVLVQGIQEQQAIIEDKQTQLDAKQTQIDALSARLDKLEAALNSEDKRGTSVPAIDKARLEQNTPNPFNENTVIRYSLPENCGKCAIDVVDANGKVVKSFNNLGAGNGQLLISAGSLTAGSYTYTLIVNGERSDSKTMVITR
jgi:Chaperone of endosialidase